MGKKRSSRRRWTAQAAEELRIWRQRQGMTHEDLGNLVGGCAASVSNWETGKYGPTVRTLPKLLALGWVDPRSVNSAQSKQLRAVHVTEMLGAAMDEAGHGPSQAASFIGVHPNTIHKWMGGVLPRPDSVVAVTNYIQTHAPECWGMLSGNPPPVEIRAQDSQQTLDTSKAAPKPKASPPQSMSYLLEMATLYTKEVDRAGEEVTKAEAYLAEMKRHHASAVAKLDDALAQLKGAL